MYESFLKAFKNALGLPKSEKPADASVKTPLEYRAAPPSAIPDTHEPSDEAMLKAIQEGIEQQVSSMNPTESVPKTEKSLDDEPPPTQRSPDSHPSVKDYARKHNPHNDSFAHHVEIADEK